MSAASVAPSGADCRCSRACPWLTLQNYCHRRSPAIPKIEYFEPLDSRYINKDVYLCTIYEQYHN